MEKKNLTKNVANFFEDLTPNDLRSIYEPVSKDETSFSTSFFIEEESGTQTKSIVKVEAILHGTIKRTCYIAYAKFQYHAWVTLNNKPYTVDKISAIMNSGNGHFTKKVTNTSSLKKLDEVYEYGNACRSASMTVKAIIGYASGTVEVRLK